MRQGLFILAVIPPGLACVEGRQDDASFRFRTYRKTVWGSQNDSTMKRPWDMRHGACAKSRGRPEASVGAALELFAAVWGAAGNTLRVVLRWRCNFALALGW